MIKSLEKAIDDINNNRYWLITKQIFEFDKVCVISNDRYNKGSDVFEYQKRDIYAKIYGLLENTPELTPTPIFTEILERTNGKFSKLNLYMDIIEQQIEKFYFVGSIMWSKNKEDFQLYPIFLLYKVLLEIGKKTGKYKISYKEFCYWVATTRTYDEWIDTVDSILHSRKTDNLSELPKPDVRYDKIVKVLPQFKFEKPRGRPNHYVLDNNYIPTIKAKVSVFELYKRIKCKNSGYIPNGTVNKVDYENFLKSNVSIIPTLR